MAYTNRRFVLARRPVGMPSPADFRLETEPAPEPGPGECLVRALYLSVDPYMRGRMRVEPSYLPPLQIGEVITGGIVGRVVESRDSSFAPGDVVMGYPGWQEYAVAPGQALTRVDESLGPLSTALGVLGMPGLTAYFGMLDVGRPKPGETVLVSGAAGAVGSVAGQIARIHGCRVFGTAGSDQKVRHVIEDLGFDGAFNIRPPATTARGSASWRPTALTSTSITWEAASRTPFSPS
jgi:NADPH-dependent curcumin reductase CurA